MMKIFLCLALIFSNLTFAQTTDESKTKISSLFDSYDGCFILYNAFTLKEVFVYNKKRCTTRVPACSSFKVVLAAIAFDSGVIKDENELFIWDGIKHPIESWNKDQSAMSWMKDSVVWVSQEITPRLGSEKLTAYLKKFNYGSADVSGGLQSAWLTSAAFLPKAPVSTLTISANEQVRFLNRLYNGKLPISNRAVELTKKLTYIDKSPSGFDYYGKTGSGVIGKNKDLRLGWFVSLLEKKTSKTTEKYIAVVSITDNSKKTNTPPYAGREAREILQNALKAIGKW